MNQLPKIYFYLSSFDWLVNHLPEEVETYLPFLADNGICDGEYAWTLQTYLRLKADGFPCELTGTMPREGIVLAHYNSLAFNCKPGPKLLIVYLKADKPLRPYAQLHVVQNTYETKTLKNSYYMPHWTQPGLIPRDSARGDRFETVGFFGTGGNLAPELLNPSWREQLKELGLQWCFKNRPQWNDFSNVDAVVAVRSFDSKNQGIWAKDQGAWKPPQKLYNAWLAGVPAIFGNEPAFRDQRRSELDYIEVNSLDETISALKRLQNDKELRQAMAENGRIRVAENHPSKLVKLWRDFLLDVAVPAYDRWSNSPNISRQLFLGRKYLGVKWNGLQRRWRSLVG
jgi:Glycosyl transferases group 1